MDVSFSKNHLNRIISGNVNLLQISVGPQIVFSLYGSNFYGSEVSLGYARVHVPCNVHNTHCQTNDKQLIRAPILTPKSTNIWASLVNWLTDRSPELKDSKVLANGTKTKSMWFLFLCKIFVLFFILDLLTSSYGEIRASIQSISKGAEKLSLDI